VGFVDRLKGFAGFLRGSDADHLVFKWIPHEEATPVERGKGYYQLQIGEMFLAKDRSWWQGIAPSVQGALITDVGQTKVTLPLMVGPSELSRQANAVVMRDQPLTTWIPYNSGSLEVELVLVGVKTVNYLERAVDAVTEISKLLAVPQLSQALGIADAVVKLGDKLLTPEAPGDLRATLAAEFSMAAEDPSNPVQSGYLAVLNTGDKTDPDLKSRLKVVDGELHTDSGHLTDFDYLLIRVLTSPKAKDWRDLSAVLEPFNKAVEKGQGGNAEQAKAMLYAAQNAGWRSADLSRQYAATVGQEILASYNEQVPDTQITPAAVIPPTDEGLAAEPASFEGMKADQVAEQFAVVPVG
jgi:hypothetical protein